MIAIGVKTCSQSLCCKALACKGGAASGCIAHLNFDAHAMLLLTSQQYVSVFSSDASQQKVGKRDPLSIVR